jgi:hypothetical protein
VPCIAGYKEPLKLQKKGAKMKKTLLTCIVSIFLFNCGTSDEATNSPLPDNPRSQQAAEASAAAEASNSDGIIYIANAYNFACLRRIDKKVKTGPITVGTWKIKTGANLLTRPEEYKDLTVDFSPCDKFIVSDAGDGKKNIKLSTKLDGKEFCLTEKGHDNPVTLEECTDASVNRYQKFIWDTTKNFAVQIKIDWENTNCCLDAWNGMGTSAPLMADVISTHCMDSKNQFFGWSAPKNP